MENKTKTPKYKKQGIQASSEQEYGKVYYALNRGKWINYNATQKSIYFDCEVCKCSVQYSHKKQHTETKKHIKNNI
jgi:hypothetical protein